MRANKRELLSKLRDRGVFLIDLKTDPVDGSSLAGSVAGLSVRCRELNPRAIILIQGDGLRCGLLAVEARRPPGRKRTCPLPRQRAAEAV
jgi:hypothetical protein